MQQTGVPRGKVLGCSVAVVVFLFACLGASVLAIRHGQESSRAAVDRVYTLAKQEDYAGMQGFVAKSGVLTLQKARAVNGAVDSWRVIDVSTQPMGRPSQVTMEVDRAHGAFVDLAILLDSMHVAVIIEYPKADWEAHREDHVIREIAK